MKKTIKFYRKTVYGVTHEYVLDIGDAKIIAQLTGKKTITGAVRELLRDLTESHIVWEEVIAPLPSAEFAAKGFSSKQQPA